MRHLIQYLLSALIVIGQTACFVRAVEVATGYMAVFAVLSESTDNGAR